jgi:chaperonin cofactor prefoldin
MWMRKRRDSLVQDLSDTAEELRSLGNRIMEISVDLAQKDLHRAAESTARMVLTLQEKEELLRRHVERLTKTGNLGRRVTDHIAERSAPSSHERGPES